MPVVALFTLFLLGLLCAISHVDCKWMRIPDKLSLLLLVGGLAFWLSTDAERLPVQMASGVALALMLMLVRFGHSTVTGRIGLGLGDIKMAGAGAVWINPMLLPLFVFAASSAGLAHAVFVTKSGRGVRLPFAPFLAFGLFSCWTTEHYL